MKKILLLGILGTITSLFPAESAIWGDQMIENILGYDKEGTLRLGMIFTLLQSKYFGLAFLGIIIGIPGLFFLHYKVIGPMVFSHDKRRVYVFNLFNRIIHLLAAISFIILVPTGLVMVFGSTFGGGTFVKLCQTLHFLATWIFVVAVLPMFFMWVKNMFLSLDDIKWLMIVGGYLNKDKKPVPAGKFNAGQKTWFWLATLGGIVMIATGLAMYFQDFDAGIAGVSQIDILRGSAIVHNVLGMATTALFFVHLYMSIFAIKGAIHSMIHGYKEEEEVEILHSSYYKKLKKEGKL